VKLKIPYDDQEVIEYGLREDNLKLYLYNETLALWFLVSPSGVNTTDNYVWGNLTHFSLYGIGGLKENSQSCSANSECISSYCKKGLCNSPATSCGNGICEEGEYCYNCYYDCGSCSSSSKVISSSQIASGDENNEIIKVDIELNERATKPDIKISVMNHNEIINADVSELSGTVYRYLNMTKVNFDNSMVKNATIEFEVSNKWIYSNNIVKVFLARYMDEMNWIKLKTEFVNITQNSSFYRAHTEGFSYFAILGENETICNEDETRCRGDDLEICLYNAWKKIWTCKHGCNTELLECNQISGNTCIFGERRCLGNILQGCFDDEWQSLNICKYGCDFLSLRCMEATLEIKTEDAAYIFMAFVGIVTISALIISSKMHHLKELVKSKTAKKIKNS
jgi:PGF-pre-PGF domain-containing protein